MSAAAAHTWEVKKIRYSLLHIPLLSIINPTDSIISTINPTLYDKSYKEKFDTLDREYLSPAVSAAAAHTWEVEQIRYSL